MGARGRKGAAGAAAAALARRLAQCLLGQARHQGLPLIQCLLGEQVRAGCVGKRCGQASIQRQALRLARLQLAGLAGAPPAAPSCAKSRPSRRDAACSSCRSAGAPGPGPAPTSCGGRRQCVCVLGWGGGCTRQAPQRAGHWQAGRPAAHRQAAGQAAGVGAGACLLSSCWGPARRPPHLAGWPSSMRGPAKLQRAKLWPTTVRGSVDRQAGLLARTCRGGGVGGWVGWAVKAGARRASRAQAVGAGEGPLGRHSSEPRALSSGHGPAGMGPALGLPQRR